MTTRAVSVAMTLLVGWPLLAQDAPGYDSRSRILVSGEAVVNVTPDKVIVTLGIETSDKDVLLAKQQNHDILHAALAAIKALGVAESDLRTDHLSIAPVLDENNIRKGLIGYRVRHTLVVTLRDAGRLEELVTTVLQCGVNHLHGIDFQSAEFQKYREQARELALQAARQKAEKMAAVLGQSIGAPLEIVEHPRGSSWGYYSGWSGMSFGQLSGNMSADVPSAPDTDADAIALGKISIRAAVQVTFELKP